MLTENLLKKVIFRYTKFGRPQYPYNIEPLQLATLILEIDRLRETIGVIVEIGAARGMTTRFLCEHLIRTGCVNQRLYAIDTFQSFLEDDIEDELRRDKEQKGDLKAMFSYNDFEAWKRNFNEFSFVEAIQSDCAVFDYSTISPIKLAFLDVDLYLPTKRALPKIYKQMSEGGIIMIDDVQEGFGAHAAYMEFCEDLKIGATIIGNKCGVVRK